MRIIAFIEDEETIKKILKHLKLGITYNHDPPEDKKNNLPLHIEPRSMQWRETKKDIPCQDRFIEDIYQMPYEDEYSQCKCQEKIKAEQENFGYFYIVTNKLDMDPVGIMKAYKSLYKIEESFRILKTNLEARPVYHFKPRRIRSHFLICYIALVLQRLLEYKLSAAGIELSTHEIMNGLSSFIFDEIDYKIDKIYMLSNKLFESDMNKRLF